MNTGRYFCTNIFVLSLAAGITSLSAGSSEMRDTKIPVPAVALMGCGPIGRVIGQCVIEKNGEVTFSKVVRGVDPCLDRDVLELIKNMPRWTPGKQDGKEVRVLMTSVFNH